MQNWRKIVDFVFPMCPIAQCWPATDFVLVQEKYESVIGADVHDEVFRNLWKFENSPEMQNRNVPLRRRGRGDPLRVPEPFSSFRRKLS